MTPAAPLPASRSTGDGDDGQDGWQPTRRLDDLTPQPEDPAPSADAEDPEPQAYAWWRLSRFGVVALVALGGLVGLLVDAVALTGEPGWGFAVGFVAASVLTAVLARRTALFLAAVLPPFAFVAFGVLVSLVFATRAPGQGLLTTVAVDTALWLTTWFPALAAAAVPTALVALLRGWLGRR